MDCSVSAYNENLALFSGYSAVPVRRQWSSGSRSRRSLQSTTIAASFSNSAHLQRAGQDLARGCRMLVNEHRQRQRRGWRTQSRHPRRRQPRVALRAHHECTICGQTHRILNPECMHAMQAMDHPRPSPPPQTGSVRTMSTLYARWTACAHNIPRNQIL